METAIGVIRSKGHVISSVEKEAAMTAILLHDIGHGPFSHTLESSIIPHMEHEEMSALLIQKLDFQFGGRLNMAIDIFSDRYEKKYLHQLIAGQLDMDRLDYLKRDSFYTGVTEGVIGSDRIIKMLNVVDDQLVVEAKGIYSVEKFLIARRLMYWQVYFHKTVVAAENLVTMLLKRARELVAGGEELFATPSLHYFLKNDAELSDDKLSEVLINNFINLDDDDITSAAKVWANHPDRCFSMLAGWFTTRSLYKVEFKNHAFEKAAIDKLKLDVSKKLDIPRDQTDYFVFTGSISNYAYKSEDEKIRILYNSGELVDIAEASDMLNVTVLSKTVKKYFLCCPKDLY